jgi:hypothetical protein
LKLDSYPAHAFMVSKSSSLAPSPSILSHFMIAHSAFSESVSNYPPIEGYNS